MANAIIQMFMMTPFQSHLTAYILTMTTPRRSNRSQQQTAAMKLRVDTREETPKGGKSSFWRKSKKTADTKTRCDGAHANNPVGGKRLDKKKPNINRQVDIHGCSNGSVEVVPRKNVTKPRQPMPTHGRDSHGQDSHVHAIVSYYMHTRKSL